MYAGIIFMNAKDETALSKSVLNRGPDVAERLFQIKDQIDQFRSDGKNEPAQKCALAVLALAKGMMLNPADVKEAAWVKAIDFAREWEWLLE
jgi:hypothetical protein